jgi:hypothetical protein
VAHGPSGLAVIPAMRVTAAHLQDEKQQRRSSVTAQSTWKKAGGKHRRCLGAQE